MFPTDTTCCCQCAAAFLLAHFPLIIPAAAAVLAAPASGLDGSGALVERAGPVGTVFTANSSCCSVGAAALHRARHCLAVVLRALPSHTDGVGGARVRCAVSKGAVLQADKPATDSRGAALWIGAGQLRRVLEAAVTFQLRGGGATFSETLAFCAVFLESVLFRRQEHAHAAVNVVHRIHLAWTVDVNHCRGISVRLPPHFYPVTNRAVCQFHFLGCQLTGSTYEQPLVEPL